MAQHSIHYNIDRLPVFEYAPRPLLQIIYLGLVSAPLLASSDRRLIKFGAAVLLLAVVSLVFFAPAFASIWCFLAAETMTLVRSTAKHMGTLIHDLVDFTTTGLGCQMPVAPAPTDLGQVCRDVVAEVKAAHPDCVIELETRGDLTGEWDADRLRQVVANLIINAVQHSGNTCGAKVTADADGPGAVTLTVHNAGPPIPPEVLPTIFEPLIRDASRESEARRRPGSIGLGLYIARAIVTAHGGTIGVTSTAEAGTTFTFRVPRAALSSGVAD